ncbi:hypothetical protein KSF_044110 [Reticulibacter mediterranei]|uniref:Uncharacterized protein n=1 Tax=Reticulibacter mediterranei TaxID=2778369 RepID=A0A8J3IL07_9CHLR|nr:hypothetical protein [Reticulibacter mediterranei]GHO94363.1 hypothetical protein KSF_044110 [Reticulibacter mediterranei]
MDTLTNDMRRQIRADTLNSSKSLPRTDALNVNNIKVASRTDTNRLYTQFYTFIKELTQVLEGDLRVKLAVPEGNMGALAEICNALIEKLILFSRWTMYSAEQTISTSHILLEHAFSEAQVAENQIRQIANVVGTLESAVASTRRLSHTLHLSAAMGREQESYFLQQKILLEDMLSKTMKEKISSLTEQLADKEHIEYKENIEERSVQPSSSESHAESTSDDAAIAASLLLTQLMANTQKQVHTLEETSHALSENVETTEASINDLYTVAQSLYASTVQVLQTTRNIGELVDVAEDWKHSIEGLRLPEEEPEEAGAEWLL